MKDPRFDPEMAAAVYASTQFKVGDKALFVARSNYGALATVLPNPSVGLSKEVLVTLHVLSPDFVQQETLSTLKGLAFACSATYKELLVLPEHGFGKQWGRSVLLQPPHVVVLVVAVLLLLPLLVLHCCYICFVARCVTLRHTKHLFCSAL